MSDTVIRPSTPSDLDAVTSIYAWNVAHGTGTFELEAPGRDEMERRRADVLGKACPGSSWSAPAALSATPTPTGSARGRPTASAWRIRFIWQPTRSGSASA